EQPQVEQALERLTGSEHTILRLNDHQLMLLVAEREAIDTVLNIADRLQQWLRRLEPFGLAFLTFGVATVGSSKASAHSFLRSALVALQRAKNLKSGRYIILEEVLPR